MNYKNLRNGDYVWFMDYSTALLDYSINSYNTFMKGILHIKTVDYVNEKIVFYECDEEVALYNNWWRCPFEKDVCYTRKMKIKKLLKNEII